MFLSGTRLREEDKLADLTRRKFCAGVVAFGTVASMNQLLLAVEDKNESVLKNLYINNRRYLGNKYKLLDYLRKIVDENCTDVKSFVDIFAGTGSVASAFVDKKIITNDILYSNYICHIAWFSGEAYDKEKVASLLKGYNALGDLPENYMSENFADTYFSASDCRKIGYIREDIERLFRAKAINVRERALLITSLLYAMDKIANTVGHYDAYRKGVAFDKHLELRLPIPPACKNKDNLFFNADANELTPMLETADVFFMDPPYNSRQYSDAYHLLENVARWEKPKVEGVARKMNRQALKSDYCTKKAEDAFADLVSKIKARYIILTYNNMGEKGNERSNAKISDEVILKALQARGEVQVFHFNHKAFTTGKSGRDDNEERIFLCKCRARDVSNDEKSNYIASPLNYTGGKFRILNQLLPNFPKDISTCVDLFCGGCNVGINVAARETVFVDSCAQLIALFAVMKKMSANDFVDAVKKIIAQFGLSDTESYGYQYYGCDSSKGLGAYNKAAYSKLRDYYVGLPEGSDEKSLVLYTLIVYGFNNQVRFNAKGKFNLPVGKRDFNAKMQAKARQFIEGLKKRNCTFICSDFRVFDLARLKETDFVYADPPYLVTTATYNENGGWTEKDEQDLLAFLDRIHQRGCRFALSNVTLSNGRENRLLIEWLERNKKAYRAIEITRNYANSNYQRKDNGASREVLVVNY